MPRDLESLIDIQQAGKRIQKFSMGISYAELVVNEEKLSAILYQITIIGEATKRLSSYLMALSFTFSTRDGLAGSCREHRAFTSYKTNYSKIINEY